MADPPRCDFYPDQPAQFIIGNTETGEQNFYSLRAFMEFAVSVLQTVEGELSEEDQAAADSALAARSKRGERKRSPRRGRPDAVAVGDKPYTPEGVSPEEAEEAAR